MTNLDEFGNALNCPYRDQFVSIYFGDLSMKIDCAYQCNLADCINDRILANNSAAEAAFQVMMSTIMQCLYSFLSFRLQST